MMATQSNDAEDWEEFMKVVASAIKSHQEPSFIDTVALALKDGVYDDYQVRCFFIHKIMLKTWFYSFEVEIEMIN